MARHPHTERDYIIALADNRMEKWWDTECSPMGGCLTAWIVGKDPLCVWPVWNNPNDETYWKVKVHNLKTDHWTKTDGRLCTRHHNDIIRILTQETEEDIKIEQATDRYSVEFLGGF